MHEELYKFDFMRSPFFCRIHVVTLRQVYLINLLIVECVFDESGKGRKVSEQTNGKIKDVYNWL